MVLIFKFKYASVTPHKSVITNESSPSCCKSSISLILTSKPSHYHFPKFSFCVPKNYLFHCFRNMLPGKLSSNWQCAVIFYIAFSHEVLPVRVARGKRICQVACF
ncbi:hypothetical protein V8G54_023829 [Vigna mungo]|uniref:Uncharacterized protein n=1 Tax=Vigna mungo TaxID=3915 RepID=A0AAQ3N4I4_VIGMU